MQATELHSNQSSWFYWIRPLFSSYAATATNNDNVWTRAPDPVRVHGSKNIFFLLTHDRGGLHREVRRESAAADSVRAERLVWLNAAHVGCARHQQPVVGAVVRPRAGASHRVYRRVTVAAERE